MSNPPERAVLCLFLIAHFQGHFVVCRTDLILRSVIFGFTHAPPTPSWGGRATPRDTHEQAVDTGSVGEQPMLRTRSRTLRQAELQWFLLRCESSFGSDPHATV